MRPDTAKRVAVELRWLRRRYANAARSAQTSRSHEVRAMAPAWAEYAEAFARLAMQVLRRRTPPAAGTWAARLNSDPRRFFPDTVELSGPGVTELVRYVVEQLALVDRDAFEGYVRTARTVEDADLNGSATDAQLRRRDAAFEQLAVELPATVRLRVPDARQVAALLAGAAGPAAEYREAA